MSKMTTKDFPFDENKLKTFLEYFEFIEYRNTGVHYISGGFTIAEYEGYDEDIYFDEDIKDEAYLYIKLKWGVQNDVEDNVNTEHYKIRITEFNKAKTKQDILKILEDE